MAKKAAKPAKPVAAKKAAVKGKAEAPKKAAAKAAPAAKKKAASAPTEKPAKAAPKAVKPVPAKAPEAVERSTPRMLRAAGTKEAAAETPAPAPVVEAKAPKAKTSKASLKLVKAEKAAADDEGRWADLHEKFKAEKAQSYDMKATFEAGRPLQHKLLGWGWILSNENDRLEVLFKDGRRILISNYNPNR